MDKEEAKDMVRTIINYMVMAGLVFFTIIYLSIGFCCLAGIKKVKKMQRVH